jgi:hypothetical protein
MRRLTPQMAVSLVWQAERERRLTHDRQYGSSLSQPVEMRSFGHRRFDLQMFEILLSTKQKVFLAQGMSHLLYLHVRPVKAITIFNKSLVFIKS